MSDKGQFADVRISCEEALDRLVSGIRVSDDSPLSLHVGSCLGCFRVAGDMREVSRVQAALISAKPTFDPGETFWNAMPDRVMASWDARLAPAQGPWPALWTWLRGCLRLPVPAAFAGGAMVGLVIFALSRASSLSPPVPGVLALSPDVAAPPTPSLQANMVTVPGSRGDLLLGTELDEALLSDLQEEELRRVLDDLGGLGATAGFDSPEAEVELTELPSAVEEIDGLDLRSLRVLKQVLGRDL